MTFKVKDGISIAGSGFVDGSRNVTANNTTLTGELRGPATFVIDPAAVGDNTGTVVIKGDLQVDGTTTTVNSTTLTVDDKNIELGSVTSPTDTTANGGGITLKGTTDKTFQWSSTTSAWQSSEHLEIAAGKNLIVNGQSSGAITVRAPIIAGTQEVYLPAATGNLALTSDIKDATITLSAGSGLTGGGSFTLNQASTGTVSFAHADTSTAANLTASGRTYVTGLTFDTYGHVTGYTTGTETVTDTNTTYDHLAVTTTGGALLRLRSSSNVNDDVKFASGANVTVAYTDDNTITISSSYTDTNTVTRLRGTASGTYTSGDLTLLAGTNVSISQVGSDYTISATDTNTITRLRGTASGTYTSGDLTLLAGSNVTITQSGSDYTIAATQPTVGAGTLGVSIGTAGATNTTVTWGTATGFNANTSTNYTYDLKVGPALTNLATLMTTAGAGFIKRGATADTYTIDTNSYLTTSGKAADSELLDGYNSTAFAAQSSINSGNDFQYGAIGLSNVGSFTLSAATTDTDQHGRYYYSGSGQIITKYLPVDKNGLYRMKIRWKSSAAAGTYMAVFLLDTSGNNISGAGTYWSYPWSGSSSPTTWTTNEYWYDGSSMPSNAAYVAFGISHTNYGGGSSTYYVSQLELERVNKQISGNTIWHAGNDGSGSGLDADLLDGLNSSQFLRSDASATNSVDLRAPIFYDSADTAYYADPNSLSSLYGVAIRGDASAQATGNQIFFWGNSGTTTSAIGFKQVGGVWAEHGRTNQGYNTYFTMDSPGRGWVFRKATVGGTNFTATNVFSISNNDGETTIGSAWGTSATFASLNVSQGQGTATTYRDIDLKGSWSGGEGHAISATHGSSSTNMVGQIVFQHDSPASRIKFGRLYHGGDQSTYPLELISRKSDKAILKLSAGSSLYKDFQQYSGSDNALVRTWDGTLVAGSDNGSALTYTIIESSVPQDSYMMGGFSIDWFENYSSTNAKTRINLAGYWNPTSNGGHIGWEYSTSNPNVTPTIQVGRNSSNGNTVFVLSHFSSSYCIIVARDLWLGYASGSDDYGAGWAISQTNSLASYTNLVSVVPRVGSGSDKLSVFNIDSNGNIDVTEYTSSTAPIKTSALNILSTGTFSYSGGELLVTV